MTDKHLALIMAMFLVSTLAHKSSTAHGLGESNDAYVGDSRGHLLTDGFGGCVKTGSWRTDEDLVDCGAPEKQAVSDSPPQTAVAEPVPKLEPKPVAVKQAVSLSAGALFDVNSATIKAEGLQELDAVAGRIKAMHEIDGIEIVGHTDSSGPESYNEALSAQRAESVKNYLLRQGVPSSSMSVKGMGEREPVASNADSQGRAKNRRVEISITGTQIP